MIKWVMMNVLVENCMTSIKLITRRENKIHSLRKHQIIYIVLFILFYGLISNLIQEVSANPLTLVNPGFEDGLLSGWQYGSNVGGGAGPAVIPQIPWNPANMFMANLVTGYISGSGVAWIYQDVTMPDSDDVRLSFWVDLTGFTYYGGSGANFKALIAPTPDPSWIGGVPVGTEELAYIVTQLGDGTWNIANTGWTVETPWFGDYFLTTDNLRFYFEPSDSIRVWFSTSINYGTSEMYAAIDNTAPVIPAPSALLLLCFGLSGVIGLRKKRLIK